MLTFLLIFVIQISAKTSTLTIPVSPSQPTLAFWYMLRTSSSSWGSLGTVPLAKQEVVLFAERSLHQPLVAAPAWQTFDHRDKASPSSLWQKRREREVASS